MGQFRNAMLASAVSTSTAGTQSIIGSEVGEGGHWVHFPSPQITKADVSER